MKPSAVLDLAPLVAFWQPILRLADWDIAASYVRHLDRTGWCSLQVNYKRARIRMMHPLDWSSPSGETYDVEYHLLHELCHPHFAAFEIPNGSAMHLHEEQAVTSFARALLTMRRMPKR